MQGTLRRIRQAPATTTLPIPSQSAIGLSDLSQRQSRFSNALVLPSGTSLSISRSHRSQASQQKANPKLWTATGSQEFFHPRSPIRSKDGRPGQLGGRENPTSVAQRLFLEKLNPAPKQSTNVASTKKPMNMASTKQHRERSKEDWERLIIEMSDQDGHKGVWKVFLDIEGRDLWQLLVKSNASIIRDYVLAAALKDNARITKLFGYALKIRQEYYVAWPKFYVRVVEFYLAAGDYETAFLWHMRMYPHFPPSVEDFGTLLSRFVVNPAPRLQTTLRSMYLLSYHRNLYDYLIPTLFASGQSVLARQWRKELSVLQDSPRTLKSQLFLRFLTRYSPTIHLTSEEQAIAQLEEPPHGQEKQIRQQPNWDFNTTDSYRDRLTARLFATSWTSAEFAVSLAHKSGLRAIGPRALQSLALREETAQGVVGRLTQLEQLEIVIEPRAYSVALVRFAKLDQGKLLRELLHCDIHFDEFDDVDSRQTLLVNAVKQQDWNQKRLLQAVEHVLQTQLAPDHFNQLLWKNLNNSDELGKARIILDRMSTLDIPLNQRNAAVLLKRVFSHLRYYKNERNQSPDGAYEARLVNRAIDVIRIIVRQDFAIRVKYWRVLLYNLGRVGRFEDLEQLSSEIVRLYSSLYQGLIPVHWMDLPPKAEEKAGAVTQKVSLSTGSRTEESARVPIATAVTAKETRKHSPYSEDFLRAEIGEKYQSPKAEPQDSNTAAGSPISSTSSTVNARTRHSPYSEEFWKAEMGEKYKPPTEEEALETQGKKLPKDKTTVSPEYIPIDLSFSHRGHPVQHIFDPRLQRAIVRWGFDITLKAPPSSDSLIMGENPRLRAFDVAIGVHLLAKLRDEGVLIDKNVIRSCLINRIGLSQVYLRTRARGRDSQEMSLRNLKDLADRAWGSEILPELPQLMQELEKQKPKLWLRYDKLYKRAYDRSYESQLEDQEQLYSLEDEELEEEDEEENFGEEEFYEMLARGRR